jgi:hypothetical protein
MRRSTVLSLPLQLDFHRLGGVEGWAGGWGGVSEWLVFWANV